MGADHEAENEETAAILPPLRSSKRHAKNTGAGRRGFPWSKGKRNSMPLIR